MAHHAENDRQGQALTRSPVGSTTFMSRLFTIRETGVDHVEFGGKQESIDLDYVKMGEDEDSKIVFDRRR